MFAIRHLIIAFAALLWCGAALADYEAGLRAANLRDFAAAYREWRPAAEAGDARAQFRLGELYEEGRGVVADAAQAARWYRLAADRGHAQARNALAILYVRGAGVARDPVEAYKWFTLAAEGGDGFATRNLEKLKDMLSAAERREGEARAAAYVKAAGD